MTPSEDIQQAAAKLIQGGMHPRKARLALAEYGVRWRYDYQRVARQGQRERTRRLKQQGRTPCPSCETGSYRTASDVHLCSTCLGRKWRTER